MNEFGLTIDPDWIYHSESLDFDDGKRVMRKLLDLLERPTAVFAVSDILAIGALKEINMSGFQVLQDIALVGFDKIAFSNMTHPMLMTVSQPMYKMDSSSASMIFNKFRWKVLF